MQNNTIYYQSGKDIVCIWYQNATQSYPTHTHAAHITLGYITDGTVCIVINGRDCLYHAGEHFCIMPDIPHAVVSVDGSAYSMIAICIPTDKSVNIRNDEGSYVSQLRQIILNAPEEIFPIADMARRVSVSPYHMLRQFKAVCGLTPHQFQIQCRVRKAQKLLEEGKSVTEAAYATGFCDQSHFDRCFRKIVRLTPSVYRQSVKSLA